jgi:hypothetical protein
MRRPSFSDKLTFDRVVGHGPWQPGFVEGEYDRSCSCA